MDNSFRFELFDPSRHDRTSFSCGVLQVDNFLKHTANKLIKSDTIRLFALTNNASHLLGFYAINAHAVHYDILPASYARNRPGHGQIPAAHISMIGVAQSVQGQGHGETMLIDAMLRIARIADQIGISVIMLDVLNCGDQEKTQRRLKLYTQKFGFAALPSNPLRLFIPIKTVRLAFSI